MKYIQKPYTLIILGSLLLFTGCSTKKTSTSRGNDYYYHGLYFGSNFSKYYKKGIVNGCKTATGEYTKAHGLFKNSKDYKDGWFLGRNRCRKFLKIDKNGDLIL
jgi:hypothetical protein